MKKFVTLFLFFLSCENKYGEEKLQNNKSEKTIEEKNKTVNIDGEKYEISGEIDLSSTK